MHRLPSSHARIPPPPPAPQPRVPISPPRAQPLRFRSVPRVRPEPTRGSFLPAGPGRGGGIPSRGGRVACAEPSPAWAAKSRTRPQITPEGRAPRPPGRVPGRAGGVPAGPCVRPRPFRSAGLAHPSTRSLASAFPFFSFLFFFPGAEPGARSLEPA